MRDSELRGVIETLQGQVGRPFAGLWQPARDRVILGLGRDGFVLMVPRGPLARVHSLAARPRNPHQPFSFQGACRAHLRGPLTALVQAESDRLVDWIFGDVRLHLRLTGRGGGLWLLRGDEVLAAYDGPAPDALPELPDLPPRYRPPRFEPEGDQSWDDAARRWFTTEEARRALEQRRAAMRRALKRDLDRSVRLARALEEDLSRAGEAPLLRSQADALAANLHTLHRGEREAVLCDLEDPERWHRIPLDPSVPPSATMERLYQRARRLDCVGDRVIDQIVRTEERIAELKSALAEVDEADRARLAELGALVPTRERRDRATQRAPWDRWIGPRGATVLVGRNEKSNRTLTFNKARGNDFWMHLRDRPGSHLVIPMKRDKTPPKELLLAAAQICLLQAKIPEGASADVQYTRVKHVRSIPGSDGARVLLHDEKVLHVRRDGAALVGWRREA